VKSRVSFSLFILPLLNNRIISPTSPLPHKLSVNFGCLGRYLLSAISRIVYYNPTSARRLENPLYLSKHLPQLLFHTSLSITYFFERIHQKEPISVRVRWDSDPRHFNPAKYTDWLRARRSTWLSYEPTKNLQTKAVFKLN
jgi:hypothetical protein